MEEYGVGGAESVVSRRITGMNIALVNSEYPSISGSDQGGIATYTDSMALACAESGDRVHVLVKKGVSSKCTHHRIHIHEYEPVFSSSPLSRFNRIINGEIFWERGYSKGLRRVILKIHEQTPVDIVEVPEYNGLASELRPPLPFPVVVHFHTPTVLVDEYNAAQSNRRRKQWYAFEKRSCVNAAGFRCPSTALKNEILQRYCIAEQKISIIRHPFHTVYFDTINKRQKNETINILFVGRLERRKGAEIILRNIRRILSLDHRLCFSFAGEHAIDNSHQYRSAIERSLSEQEGKRIFFLGPVKREKLPVLYCRSNMLLFPSLFENAPFTLLEAMAARLPIVAANTGGIPELIRHGKTGLLFNPQQPEELLSQIRLIIENPETAALYARNAYQELINEFNPVKIATRVNDFYASIIHEFKNN